jgi:hypothetical protein
VSEPMPPEPSPANEPGADESRRPAAKESPLGVWFDAAPFDGWSEYAYMDSEEHP